MDNKNRHSDIDRLLNRIFTEDSKVNYYPLQELFEQRLEYLNITKHHAQNILDIDHKTLSSILSGDAKKVDFVTILKLSDFLEISVEEIINKYFKLVHDIHHESITAAKKRSFIVNNFNLTSLKKIGFINSINDFEHIEKAIVTFFGYESVFDHNKHRVTAAFSSGKRSTNKENLSFWYAAACQSLDKTPNPYQYDREGLIEYFPQIRWHSMNVERGLLLVAQALFKFGVTLIVVPKFTTDLHLRGATMKYRDKPCIVLTKYTAFYGSMWFALLHELFHVLYDWEEIRNEKYHITGETESIHISEPEADNFARQYLFADQKMDVVKSHISDAKFVKAYAEQNHVHPSIIYTFYCWDTAKDSDYARFNKFMPNFDLVLERFNTSEFSKFSPVPKISNKRNVDIYTI
ncbi:hypothetical protein GM921_09660 [Pedobacter sp. LMG 31464]|uniref:HTH cro/C1-type domain-containing protein n=1 Tax=Pedobacter planticolens TaxID=2679964 RepID=A0A923IWZ8_9SPHI|nr:helix-turn-helix transcriptional regulator [Pedobacter planticolens]MBB2145752.1 hypothetical protein [Pedobacter planticolens]